MPQRLHRWHDALGPWGVTDLGLALVGALVLGIGGWMWRSATADEALGYAKARDAVLIEARQNLVVLNTLDATKVDAGLTRWKDVTTGVLHDQIEQANSANRDLIAKNGSVTTGKVVDAAMTAFDERAGTAQVIAAVELAVKDAKGATTLKRNRFSADLSRVGDQWKLSRLEQVAVAS